MIKSIHQLVCSGNLKIRYNRTVKTWQKIKENPKLIEKYLIREKVIDTTRCFFKNQNFHEVFTPILVPIPSAESNLEVFETALKTSQGTNRRGFLIMSPEYSLKKLICAGIGNVFEITRCFRNEEEVSRLHNPEFTMIEWYRVGATYLDVMRDVENLFVEIVKSVGNTNDLTKWIYQGETYDISLPWERISVAEAFKKFANIDIDTLLSENKLKLVASNKGYSVSSTTTWEQLFYQIFFNEVESNLKKSHRPFFVYDYPLSQAALAKRKKEDPRFAERFEAFLAGVELGNCFSELTDHVEQQARFKDDLELRKRLGKTEYGVDEDLIKALKSGMPEVSGIAVGVDRLVMLAANVPAISDVLFFPAHEIFDLKSTD